ncbi:MAG TPA: response regulator [Anaerolineae bacterium]|nr:response regulator [Anaerolineae bacterium]HXV98703.1 response regulator [Anaerolineae bacterium]
MASNPTDSIRVLYVEDDKTLQSSLSQMLEILGYEVACADNGKQGVEKAESWLPDIILMDMRMPVMSGDQAILVLRSKPATSQIPIFVLSAFTDAKTRDLCKQVGANKFFTKPPDVRKIDADIKELINHKK